MISVAGIDLMNLKEWSKLNNWALKLTPEKEEAEELKEALSVLADLLDSGNDLTVDEVKDALDNLAMFDPPEDIEDIIDTGLKALEEDEGEEGDDDEKAAGPGSSHGDYPVREDRPRLRRRRRRGQQGTRRRQEDLGSTSGGGGTGSGGTSGRLSQRFRKGGAGSGNFGHSGRMGEIGGSGPGGGGGPSGEGEPKLPKSAASFKKRAWALQSQFESNVDRIDRAMMRDTSKDESEMTALANRTYSKLKLVHDELVSLLPKLPQGHQDAIRDQSIPRLQYLQENLGKFKVAKTTVGKLEALSHALSGLRNASIQVERASQRRTPYKPARGTGYTSTEPDELKAQQEEDMRKKGKGATDEIEKQEPDEMEVHAHLSTGDYSHEDKRRLISAALDEEYPRSNSNYVSGGNGGMVGMGGMYWIQDIFDEAIVVRESQTGKLYSIDYTFDDGDVTFDSDPVEVELQYVPKDEAADDEELEEEEETETLGKQPEDTRMISEDGKSVASIPGRALELQFDAAMFDKKGVIEWLKENEFRSDNITFSESLNIWIAGQKKFEAPNGMSIEFYPVVLTLGVSVMLARQKKEATEKIETKTAVPENKISDYYAHAELKLKKPSGDEDDVDKIIKAKDFVIEGWASTTDIDRTKDIVHAEAFTETIEDYKENPILLYAHKPERPIGTVTELNVMKGKGLHIKANISRTEPDVRTKIMEGVLRAFSFGFRPVDVEEERKGADVIRHVKKVELFEVSIVPIPMNKRALFSMVKALSLGGSDLVCKSCPEGNCTCKPAKGVSKDGEVTSRKTGQDHKGQDDNEGQDGKAGQAALTRRKSVGNCTCKHAEEVIEDGEGRYGKDRQGGEAGQAGQTGQVTLTRWKSVLSRITVESALLQADLKDGLPAEEEVIKTIEQVTLLLGTLQESWAKKQEEVKPPAKTETAEKDAGEEEEELAIQLVLEAAQLVSGELAADRKLAQMVDQLGTTQLGG